VEPLRAISGCMVSVLARSCCIAAGERGEESPGKSAFSSDRPETGKSSSLCLGDSRLGDRQVELMLNYIPGPIYRSINACIDYYKLATKCWL